MESEKWKSQKLQERFEVVLIFLNEQIIFMSELWEFYLPSSSISRRELWTLAAESGLKIAIGTKGTRLYAVVNGPRDQISEFYTSLQKSYRASRLNPYRGLVPNFEGELEYIKLESVIESTKLLSDIAENTSKLSSLASDLSNLASNVAEQLNHTSKRSDEAAKKAESKG